MAAGPVLYLCRGEDCRHAAKAGARLVKAVGDRGRVIEVGCQKICEGPVCGLEVDGRLQWFARVDSDKARDGVRAALEGKPLARALEKRRRDERQGRLRR